MGDRSAAQARFIGEDAPLEAHQHHLTEGPTGCGLTGEGVGENRGECFRHAVQIGQQHQKACSDVEDRHQRNNGGGRLGDAFDAPDHDSENQGCQNDSGRQPRDADQAQGRRHLKGLNPIANAEARQHAEEGKQARHPAPAAAESVADVVHRPTHVVAVSIGFAELNREHRFGVLGCDAEDRDDPHPKDGTRSTNGDGPRHTGNVSRADRGRQRGHQRLEGGDLPFRL